MPKKKKRQGGGSSSSGQSMPSGYSQVAQGYQDWNTNFQNNAQNSIDYAQNNPWAQGAQSWYADMLGPQGGMQNNPWSSRLYGQTEGLDMNQGLGYLNDYLGGGEGGSGGSGTGRNPRPRGGYSGGGGGSYSGGSSTSRGHIPDSTVGQGFFSGHINELFDPAALDPANDPTLQPTTDAITREAEEAYWRSVADITNQAEGAGRYGSGLYQGMRAQQGDEYHEALQGTLAQLYGNARNAAMQRRMEALGLVNNRDIAEGQLASNENIASMSAASSGANARYAYDAQMDQNRLQAIQMMLGAGQFGMQMGGNMAELTQNGQIAANQIGQGWAQIGQHGYDQSGQFGQLGLAGLGGLQNIYSDAAANRARQAALQQQQQQWQDGAFGRDMNDMIRMMTGLGQLSGDNIQEPYIPSSPGPAPGGFNWGDALGSIMGGAGTYLGNR